MREPLAVLNDEVLTLAALQSLARQRNPSVEQWAAQVRAARARVLASRAGYFPQLRSDGQFVVLEDEIDFEDPFGNRIVVVDRRQYTQTTALSYRVTDWGRTHSLHQARQHELAGEEASRRRRLQGLDLQVAELFYWVLESREDLATALASVATLEGALRLVQGQRQVGGATRADELVVEANLERRRFLSRQLEDLVENGADDLARLLDLEAGARFEMADPETRAMPDALSVARWQELAVGRREELRVIEARHEALYDARRAETAAFFPEVGVFFQHAYSTTDSDFREPNLFSGGFQADWSIFDGGLRSARMRELEAQAQGLRAEHRGVRRAILDEVRRESRALARAYDGVEVARVVVAQAEENLARLTELFRQGRATGQELLEAEELLTEERARAARARFGVLRAVARLRFVCGTESDDFLSGDAADGTTEVERAAP